MRWAAAAVVLAACGGPPVVPESRFALVALNGDGATGLDAGAVVGFALDGLTGGSEGPTAAQISAVESGLSVATWPEDVAVATTAVPTVKRRNDRVEVGVVASAPLAERWYAVKLSAPPPSKNDPSPSHVNRADGTKVALFRVGSAPQLLDVALYSPKGAMTVTFSEPVMWPAGGAGISFTQNGKTVACDVTASVVPPGPVNPAPPTSDHWGVTCSPAFDPKTLLTLTIEAVFQTANGVPCRGLPITDAFAPASLDTCGDGCFRRYVFAVRGPR